MRRILTDRELISALAIWIADHLEEPKAVRNKDTLDLFCKLEAIIEKWINIHENKL